MSAANPGDRRGFLRGLLAAAFGMWSARRSSAAVLVERYAAVEPCGAPGDLLRGFRRTQAFQRRYRADAAILFCGVTLFTRREAGGARACVETGSGENSSALGLHFAAGSDPSRCAGLNRFGILQEAVVESSDSRRFSFAGLITQSKEEDLEEARKALQSAGALPVKLARGTGINGHADTWTETVQLDHPCTWKETAEVLASLARAAPQTPARQMDAAAEPFLCVVRTAALSNETQVHRPFLHAGKLYTLELRRRSATERDGVIRNQHGAKSAEFRVAYDPADPSGLPTRIEYRAKPYLKLVFEAAPAASPEPLSLFPQQAAQGSRAEFTRFGLCGRVPQEAA